MCFSLLLPNNLILSKEIKVLLFELLLQTENTDVPTSVTGDLGSRCFGILNDGIETSVLSTAKT